MAGLAKTHLLRVVLLVVAAALLLLSLLWWQMGRITAAALEETQVTQEALLRERLLADAGALADQLAAQMVIADWTDAVRQLGAGDLLGFQVVAPDGRVLIRRGELTTPTTRATAERVQWLGGITSDSSRGRRQATTLMKLPTQAPSRAAGSRSASVIADGACAGVSRAAG